MGAESKAINSSCGEQAKSMARFVEQYDTFATSVIFSALTFARKISSIPAQLSVLCIVRRKHLETRRRSYESMMFEV